jgi:hypothetical protein
MDDRLSQALWISLAVALGAVLVIKMLTGIALMPLALIAMLIMGFAFGMTLRVQRGARRD